LRSVKDLFHQINPELQPTYIVLVLATFTSIIHRVTTQSMLPLYATSQLGLTPKEVGVLFTISGLSVFAMILPAGFVIDKVGRKWATVPSTGIPALAFLFIPFSETFFQLAILVAFLRRVQRAFARVAGDLDLRRRAGERPRTPASPTPYDRGDWRGRRAAARRLSHG